MDTVMLHRANPALHPSLAPDEVAAMIVARLDTPRGVAGVNIPLSRRRHRCGDRARRNLDRRLKCGSVRPTLLGECESVTKGLEAAAA